MRLGFLLLRLSICLGLFRLFNECRPHFLCHNRSNFLHNDGNLFLRRSLFHGSCHCLGFGNGCSGFLSRHFFLQFFLGLFFRNDVVHQLLQLGLRFGFSRFLNSLFNNSLYGCRLNVFLVGHVHFLGHVVESHTIVKCHGIKLCKRFVHQFLHHRIGREGNLRATLDDYTLACVHIHTFAVLHLNHLEGAQAFHLGLLLVVKGIVQHVNDGGEETLCLLFRYLVLIAQVYRQILYPSHCVLLSLVFP